MNKLYLSIIFLVSFNSSIAQSQDPTVGLILNTPNSTFQGYNLFSPMNQNVTYLIDNNGEKLHSWSAKSIPGHTVYLDEEGSLFRTGQILDEPEKTVINGLGGGGLIEKYDWFGSLTWEYEYSNELHRQHHDFKLLPNGNVIILAWEVIDSDEAIDNGRDPSTIDPEVPFVWPEHLIEVKPEGISGGEIVWEWHAWDHLIQDFDDTKLNFGNVSDSPHLIDVNFNATTNPDWLHANAIDYNPVKDQILISLRDFHEFWIIDHSTTSEEAKGHEGGNAGKGGDLLYRWGNNASFQKGDEQSKKLFGQHNVHWIPNDLPNGGKIMIFNNGQNRLEGSYTSVEIIDPLEDENGYVLGANGAFQPVDTEYSYTAEEPTDFLAGRFSSAQQLPNGNILICDGPLGTFFEIDSNDDIVWKYINPATSGGILDQGANPFGINWVFHVKRFSPEYSGFTGKVLDPKGPIESYPEEVTGVMDNRSNSKSLHFYPNPASDFLYMSNLDTEKEILIYNLYGQLIKQELIRKGDNRLAISNLEKGIYMILVNGEMSKLLIEE